MFFAVDANFFLLELQKKINNIFLINLNKISIDSYLNEKLRWANQTFVDSAKHFSGCIDDSHSSWKPRPCVRKLSLEILY